jgi:hypothetical protein
MTMTLSKKFEAEKNLLDEKCEKNLRRSEKEIQQADQALTSIKSAVKNNSPVVLLTNLLGSFTKSLNGTRELIEGIKSTLKEKGLLERSVQVFHQEIQNKVVRTVETRHVTQQVTNSSNVNHVD